MNRTGAHSSSEWAIKRFALPGFRAKEEALNFAVDVNPSIR